MRVGHGRKLDGRRRRARLPPNPTKQTNTSTDKAPRKQKKPRRGRLPVIIAALLGIAAVGLDPKTYELGVGAENVDENRFPQRFTLTQGSKTLWTSGVVMPGERIESVVAPLAEEGDAHMEVQALDPETSAKHGSPTAVEVSIVTMTEEEDPA